jgi:GDP-L-fucose synthase
MSSFSKILLLGGNGFVGKNFKKLNEKFNVIAPSSKELDLKKFINVKNYLKENNPDLVINLAGVVGGILINKENNFKFLDENIQINQNLIRALYDNKILNYLNVSSSCIYPKNISKSLTEDLILSGKLEETNEGYALAKIAALKSCNYISRECGYNYKTIIPCNLYGPYDNFNQETSHMIPGVISRMYEAKLNGQNKFKVWGDGFARREFMYVIDFVNFLFFAIENFKKIPNIINVGLGYDYSVIEYYNFIANSMKVSFEYSYDKSKPTGMSKKLVDISEVNKLGWQPKYTISSGIEETIKYYEKEIIKI